MAETRAEFTKEQAKSIIKKKRIIHAEGAYEIEPRVGTIPFDWETSEGQYFIVNTNLTTSYLHKKAIDHYKKGEYNDAANCGLSGRASLTVGDELRQHHNASVKVEFRPVKDSEELALMIVGNSFKPMKAMVAEKVSMKDFDDEVIKDSDPEAIAAATAAALAALEKETV